MSNPDIGPQLPQPDPRGELVFRWLSHELRRAEDATAAADYAEHARRCGLDWHSRPDVWLRDATATEKQLLAHLGYTPTEDLQTRIQFVTDTVRHRSWPTLQKG